MARRCAVLGHPIGHSLSPALHRAAYDALGLDWTYEAVDVTGERLEVFLDGLDEQWRGLSLTMPLKREVRRLLDRESEQARRSGVVNTVLLDGDGRSGDNTDIPGAVTALDERYDGPVTRAVVLGGGATATSMVHALADRGCRHVTIRVRDAARAADTVAASGRHPRAPEVVVRALDEEPVTADIVVSTVPVGAQTAAVVRHAEGARAVFDAVYDPWPTPLAAYALASGQVLVSGLDLLVHQAALQVELMTGVAEAPLAAMRRAGEAAWAASTGHGASHR